MDTYLGLKVKSTELHHYPTLVSCSAGCGIYED